MTTKQIANRLIELCQNKQFSVAREELYAENAVSIEGNKESITGLKAMEEKEKNWHSSIEEIHSVTFSEPLVTGSFFSMAISWDLTYKGKERGGWEEIAVFGVKDQKVVLEQFFY